MYMYVNGDLSIVFFFVDSAVWQIADNSALCMIVIPCSSTRFTFYQHFELSQPMQGPLVKNYGSTSYVGIGQVQKAS